VGIQPQKLDWGEQPTPEVAAAIPVACAEIMKLLKQWEGLPQ
jgi:hydrogenase maturation protease